MEELKKLIRAVPDWPKKGILFYDLTTLIKDRGGFHQVIDRFADHYSEKKIDIVIGIEARGFIFGSALAYKLNAGFVPVRKLNKLPAATSRVTYDLEYGSDSLEIHCDAVNAKDRVLIVDDLLATGGTAKATVQLAKETGAHVLGIAIVVELEFLNGRSKLDGVDVFSLMKYRE
jgi:adenine phosphoribosyltransferase